MEKKSGYYFGTEIEGKWWRPYMDNGFFVRGNGDYWISDDGIYFLRKLTKQPIFISFHTVKDIKLGYAHAGKWVPGVKVLKIIWKRNEKLLSSGFIFGRKRSETLEVKQILDKKIARYLQEEF